MPANDQQLLLLARRHQDQLLAIRDRTRLTLERLWAVHGTNPSDYQLERWLAAAVPVLETSTSTAAAAAIAYVSSYTIAAAGQAERNTLTASAFTSPRGVAAVEVLTRPFVTLRTALSQGRPMPVARELAGQRAAQIGATDPMLAARSAGSAAMKAEPRIVGYRRVPDSGACSFCRLAATQRYTDSDLMPIHPGCGCTVAPIIGTKDPGQIIDREQLKQLKADGVIDEVSLRRKISSTEDVAQAYEAKAKKWREEARTTPDQEAETRYAKRADSWKAKAVARRAEVDDARLKLKALQSGRLDKLTTVHDHGELGPTLYPAGTQFTTV
jgi:hypothetical protein